MIEYQTRLSHLLPYLVRIAPKSGSVEVMWEWCEEHVGQKASDDEAYPYESTVYRGGMWHLSKALTGVWRFRNYEDAFAFLMRWSGS